LWFVSAIGLLQWFCSYLVSSILCVLQEKTDNKKTVAAYLELYPCNCIEFQELRNSNAEQIYYHPRVVSGNYCKPACKAHMFMNMLRGARFAVTMHSPVTKNNNVWAFTIKGEAYFHFTSLWSSLKFLNLSFFGPQRTWNVAISYRFEKAKGKWNVQMKLSSAISPEISDMSNCSHTSVKGLCWEFTKYINFKGCWPALLLSEKYGWFSWHLILIRNVAQFFHVDLPPNQINIGNAPLYSSFEAWFLTLMHYKTAHKTGCLWIVKWKITVLTFRWERTNAC